MNRLLTSTALVIAIASPALAQTGSKDFQSRIDEMGIKMTNLIDMRLYMPNLGQDGALTEELSSQSDADGELESAAENAMPELAEEVADVPEHWQMVGDIDDLVVTTDGELRALLVDAGGFLGIGQTDREIRIENIRFVQDSDDEGMFYVVYTGDPLKFQEQRSYDPTIARSEGTMRASEDARLAGWIDESPQRQEEPVDWSNLTTEDVLGAAVYGSNNEWIGDLSELHLADDGQVEGAIIDVGGFLGIGEKPVEMALDQVEVRRAATGQIRAYVSATEEELEELPTWRNSES